MDEAIIENGFAKVGHGKWLVGGSQPTAVLGDSVMRSLKGWFVPDRMKLRLIELEDSASCGSATKPFLTQIACAAPLTVVSTKILIAPATARTDGKLLRIIPFSFKHAICVTEFGSGWVVVATQSRTTRISLKDDELLTVRVESAVAWTTKRPTGFCPRITLKDIFIPKRRDGNLMLHFYGPGIIWLEGSNAS